MAYACDIAGIVAATASCVSALAAMGAFVAAVWNYRGTHRPDVIAYLEADAKTEYVSFCIGNFGDRTAHDVSMSFSEKIDVEDDEDREHLASFANAGITTLPPGAVKKTAAGCMTDRAYSEGREYVVTVRWARKRGSWKRRMAYSLDYRSFCEALEYVE